MGKKVTLKINNCTECPYIFEGYDTICNHSENKGYPLEFPSHSIPSTCPLEENLDDNPYYGRIIEHG